MVVILGLVLTGLSTLAGQGGGDVVLRHDISPKYNRTEYESACESTVFRVRFGNAPGSHGRVDWVSIDGRPVAGAAEQLNIRAARRVISRIGIMNCGSDPRRPVLEGVMQLSPFESQSLGMRPSLFFRLTRDGREGWRLTID